MGCVRESKRLLVILSVNAIAIASLVELQETEYYSRLAEKGKLDVDRLPSQYLSAINSEGYSLLMIAVKHNQLETVEALLKTGLSEEVRDMQHREVSNLTYVPS